MRLPSFRQLSTEQDRVYSLPLNKNYLVTGPPGTGKTVIALYRASLYHKQQKRPKIISFSKLLSTYTDDAAKELKIDGYVATYHSWVFNTYRNYFGDAPPELEKWVFDWDQITPKLVMRTLNNKPCLLIDEAQDLPPGFFLAAALMAEHLTVFADENQRITDTQSTLDDIRQNAAVVNEFKLTRNYRNTKEIAKVAACFYAGLPSGKPDIPTRGGNLPVAQITRDIDSTIDLILRFEQNHTNLEIGVFTRKLNIQRLYYQKLKGRTKRPVECYENSKGEIPTFGKPGIKLINYQSVKGLEFDAVFVPELDSINMDFTKPENRMMFYVLLSRAREHLYLVFNGPSRPAIFNYIPDTLIEFRK